MRVAIVGNCQARPLAEILTAIFDVEVSTSVIVHLVRPQDEPLHRPGLQSADVILAQRVAENYPTPFVRTEALHAEHGAKVQVWQNLYFAGYRVTFSGLGTFACQIFVGAIALARPFGCRRCSSGVQGGI